MNRKAITLIELLITLLITSLIIMGFSSIELFSSRQVLVSNRVIETQNEASYIVETIVKKAVNAIGDAEHPAAVAGEIFIGGKRYEGIKFLIDCNAVYPAPCNGNGIREDFPVDRWVAFTYYPSKHQMRYHPNFGADPNQDVEIFSSKAYMPDCGCYLGFNPTLEEKENFVTFEIVTCWDPRNAKISQPCNSVENPQSRIRVRIALPGVSTN